MEISLNSGAELLKKTTGIDVTKQAKAADDYVSGGANAAKQTTEAVFNGVVTFPGVALDLLNPGGTQVQDPAQDTNPTTDASEGEKSGLSNLAESFANLNQFDLGEISNLINDLQAGLLTGDIDQEGIFLLQSLLQQQMQLISTISNVQKQQHDAQMAVINNIR